MGTLFHVGLTVGNALLCVSNLAIGDYGWAAFQGALAGILAWQLTW
jgi:hypothetical protein